jgi:outer membrane protein assembly factor BamB
LFPGRIGYIPGVSACARVLVAVALLCLVVSPPQARAADASTAWMTNPQHDGELTDSPLRPPLAVRWDLRLGTVTSNVVVADGRVIFVRTDATNAPQLTALDAASGAHLWSVATPAARIAYDGGRVFATQGTGVAAFSAQTGARLWTSDLQADYGVPHLVADGGTVYALVDEPGSRVAALRATDGGEVWRSPSLSSGESSPALDTDRVYIGFGGGQTYALSRATGQVLWHHDTCCSGGGGTSVVIHGGRLYAEAWTFKVLDPATGQMIGTYVDHNGTDYSQPVFAGTLGIFRPAGGLLAAGPDGTTRWSFAAPAQRPITAGGHAYTVVGEFGIDDPAAVVALDLGSGAPVWCADLGIRPYPDGHAGPVSGGNGLIVVPVDDRLVAYGNGGTGSACGATGSAPPVAGGGGTSRSRGSAVEVASPGATGPRVTLRAARTRLILGERTRLTGAVTRVKRAGGLHVRIEADDHPFGRFRTLVRVRTRRDGTYAALLEPAKNVRLRAVLERARPAVRTASLTVWTDLPIKIRRLDAGSPRPRVRVTLLAPRRAGIRHRRVVFYLATAGDASWQRIDSVRWRRRSRLALTATATYPAGRLGTSDRVLVCTREPRPDAFGEPVARDRDCGAPQLPRTPR